MIIIFCLINPSNIYDPTELKNLINLKVILGYNFFTIVKQVFKKIQIMKVYKLKAKQFIKQPIEEVFGFFSRPENLTKITPSNLNFKILTPSPLEMKQGTVIDYTIKLFKVPIHWRTLITTYEPPFKFVDEQMKGPYNFWHHTHMFKENSDGVEIFDEVHYSIPFGPLGNLLHSLWIKKDLNHIFEYRKSVIENLFKE